MANWWKGNPYEKYWVEIRQLPGIGTYLTCPVLNQAGQRDPWYELVASVSADDVVFHWSVREGRFVGTSRVSGPATVVNSGADYFVELVDFTPLSITVDRHSILAKADRLYELHDDLEHQHGRPLRLPFQFTADRARFRFMSNYFAKMPVAFVDELFGSETPIAGSSSATSKPGTKGAAPAPAFLAPFKAKADTGYDTFVSGGPKKRSRKHETLVNDCAIWLKAQGYEPARSSVIDLGLLSGDVIIEAKVLGDSLSNAVREGIGQLYEYRFFRIANPAANLIFLSDERMPHEWVRYLEEDREIGVMWRSAGGFTLSRRAQRALEQSRR